MARLTASQRRALPKSSFAGPGRSYPIENASHARNALARASGKPVAAQVRAAVHAKYPGIGKTPHHHLNRMAHGTRSGY